MNINSLHPAAIPEWPYTVSQGLRRGGTVSHFVTWSGVSLVAACCSRISEPLPGTPVDLTVISIRVTLEGVSQTYNAAIIVVVLAAIIAEGCGSRLRAEKRQLHYAAAEHYAAERWSSFQSGEHCLSSVSGSTSDLPPGVTGTTAVSWTVHVQASSNNCTG